VKNPVQDRIEWEDTEQMLYDLVEAAASLEADSFLLPEVKKEEKKEEEKKEEKKVEGRSELTSSSEQPPALRSWKKNLKQFSSKDDITNYYSNNKM
jgi:hypothetical protein